MAFDATQGSYVALRDVIGARTHPVVVWCGAGLSIPAGLPTWTELRTALEKSILKRAESLDLQASAQLLGRAEGAFDEKNPWIAFQRLRDLGPTTYRDTIREALIPAATSNTNPA